VSFFSTSQLIAKLSEFVHEGVPTKESIYALIEEMGFELAEIKPFSYVWICTHKTA